MNNLTRNRKTSLRWLAVLGLALAVFPMLATDASAGGPRGGHHGRGYGGHHYYGRGYGGYAPRGYGYGPRVYNRGYGGFAPRGYGYGYGPRVYNRGFGGFYNSGVPYGAPYGYGAPFSGFSLRIGGFPY